MWETYIPIVVAIIALLGTLYNSNVTRGKMDKTEAVILEGRLKDFEAGQKLIQQDVKYIKENMMTPEQKACLLIVDERVNTILAGLGTFVPKIVKNPGRLDPILDILSIKAQTGGWASVISYVKVDLDTNKRTELLAYLEKVSSDKRFKSEKRNWATLYLGLLRLELDREDPEACVAAT